jgi:hypothetical protein
MMMAELFEQPGSEPDSEHERTCGSCLVRKANEEFYKDGKDHDGNIKYRRDCKDCYRVTRLRSRRAKQAPKVEVKPRSRRKK